MNVCRRLGSLVCGLFLCVVLAGCGSGKVTSENLLKIKPGMTEQEVTGILGSPTTSGEKELAPGMKVKESTWTSGNNSIEVMFKDGKVMGQKGKFGG